MTCLLPLKLRIERVEFVYGGELNCFRIYSIFGKKVSTRLTDSAILAHECHGF
jgi:hypothetical protein